MTDRQPPPGGPDAVEVPGSPLRAERPTLFIRRPDSSRRRAWMLVLITVVALVPIGVGLAVSNLVGQSTAPAGPRLPPTVTVSSSAGAVRVKAVSYSWTSGIHHAVAQRSAADASSEAQLSMAPKGTLTFAFSGKAAPTLVELGLTKASSQVVAASNPLTVSFTKPPGTYSVVVSTTWTQGQADYYLRVKVT